MQPEKYERTVSMQCPTCGGYEFEMEDENQESFIKCVGCNYETSRQTLIDENAKNIQAHVDEVKQEIVSDFQKEFNVSLKKAFGNNKFFRIK